jgi:hypothetical protein
MPTCNRLDLQIPLGSQPIMPKNLPEHGFLPVSFLFAKEKVTEPLEVLEVI